jgi:excinuclease ABC subunit C
MNRADNEDHIRTLLRTLPDSPGVYQYYDRQGVILYVGKARNLKKRVSSYFNKESGQSGKVMVMVRKIADIRTIVVDTEYDALLLENTLIKKFQPRYNIMLKDDKTYPWICIRNEDFPRIYPTRTIEKDGSLYFGPYASVRTMNNLLELIRKIYPIRTCHYNLSPEAIARGKYRVCLEFQIGNCLGPCEGRQTAADYQVSVDQIVQIIKGNISTISQHFHKEMMEAAAHYKFEEAQEIKEKLELLEKFQSRSVVVNPSIQAADVFTIIDDEQSAWVNFTKVKNGAIIQAQTVEMRKKLDENPAEMLMLAIAEFRERGLSDHNEILLPMDPGISIPGVSIQVPQKGDKKKLIDLSLRNAMYFKAEKEKQRELADPERHSNRIMEKMKSDLRLQEWPETIECIDNSNIQGDHAVAALVVFKKGKPAKSEYRHFNIKTVTGPDDFASMQEVITRRYTRIIEEGKPLPQLLIVDGGKGQLSSAVECLKRIGIYGKMGVIGIAKKLEEIYYPGDSLPMYLDKKSETLRVIQHLRDEAHRFGITHHRKKREKHLIRTELTEIKGIGEVAAQRLLSKIGSVKLIKESSLEQITEVLGKSKALLVFQYFHEQPIKK